MAGNDDDLRGAFRAKFPEFESTPDVKVDAAIEEAKLVNNIRQLVTLYIAAHILTITAQVASGITTVAGAVKMDRVGPLTTQYISLVADGDIKAELARTQYGARALLLESRSARSRIGAMVSG